MIAFIVLPYSEELLEGTIDAYIDSFAGPPWFENWEPQTVEKIIRQAAEKQGFIGKAATARGCVLGAAFGYSVPKEDTETVAFSRIYPLLEQIGWQDAFYIAEVFVRQQFQKQGLGTSMLRGFSYDKECDRGLVRTINKNLLKAVSRAWGCEEKELFYDPVKTERIWYGVERNGNQR